MEELSTVDALVQVSFLIQGVLADVAAAQDLSVTQLRLLGVLRDREPGMQELAAHLGLDKSSVSGLVDRAERRDLLRRSRSAVDGRAVTVALTPAGRRLAALILRTVSAEVDRLVAPLSAAQQRELTRLASRLLPAG